MSLSVSAPIPLVTAFAAERLMTGSLLGVKVGAGVYHSEWGSRYNIEKYDREGEPRRRLLTLMLEMFGDQTPKSLSQATPNTEQLCQRLKHGRQLVWWDSK